MFRRRRRDAGESAAESGTHDRALLDSRWRALVDETVAARERVQLLAAQCRPESPLYARLQSVAARVDAGVSAAWDIANRAQTSSRMLESLDLDDVQSKLKAARRRLASARETAHDASTIEAEVELLSEQHAALNQLSNSIDDAAERLRVLDLRLDAAVARAAQVLLAQDAVERFGAVEHELMGVVDELEAVRAGLDAVRSLDG